MRGLKDRVAIVTGTASPQGMGFASARRLAEEGCKVLLADTDPRNSERAEELVRKGLAVAAFTLDVTREADWDAAVNLCVDRWGGLDILVNNAGISVVGRVADFTVEEWEQQFGVNVTGTFIGCRAAVRRMIEQGRGGAIVNMSSVAALVTAPGAGAYASSKAAVQLLTKTLALEGAEAGIRVNSVHPGVIQTEMLQRSAAERPETTSQISATIPLGRLGNGDDVAPVVAFLASDEASYCTGASFVVDGGVTIQ